MAFIFPDALELKRVSRFPANVSGLYSCGRRRFPADEQEMIFGKYEVTVRLDSDARLCRDEIDGRIMNIPFPNVVFKRPGMRIRLDGVSPREAIGFSYPAETVALLRSWGLFPEEPFLPLRLGTELQRLVGEFRKFIRICTSLENPGDRIDGICFDILRELLFVRQGAPAGERTPESRIREVELYFQHHFDEKLALDTVAEQFGFSHASFYQYWKRTFHTTPHRYVEELKLRAAAAALLRSKEPLAEIVRELQFSGAGSFHRKFRERFHATPGEFRRERERWAKELADLFSE